MTRQDGPILTRKLTRRAFVASSAGLVGLAALGLRGARGSAQPPATQASLVQPGGVHRAGGDAGCLCPVCTSTDADNTALV